MLKHLNYVVKHRKISMAITMRNRLLKINAIHSSYILSYIYIYDGRANTQPVIG